MERDTVEMLRDPALDHDCLHRMRAANEIERLREALRELVACKDLKESLPTLTHDLAAWGKANADYQRRKPLAWERAREAMVPNAELTGDALARRPG